MSIKKHSLLALQRLANQHVAQQQFRTPREVVQWMGFMQAQDYAGAKWSIGLRLPGITDANIEAAVADKSIVRNWAFRGTLHFMSPADIRWMLALCRPRVAPKFATQLKKLELDKSTLAKAQKIIAQSLQGGAHLTRIELMTALRQKKVTTGGLRANFIMLTAALDGLICCGVRRGKQFTYTLLDEWLPAVSAIKEDEALTMLAERYFTSHGPATINDFAWWTGVTLADARAAVEPIKLKMVQEKTDGITYYHCLRAQPAPTACRVFLLPGFDEYLLGYKDRSAAVAPEHFRCIAPTGNGLFAATIVANGQVVGTWRRTSEKNRLSICTMHFAPVSQMIHKQIVRAAKEYSHFAGLPLHYEQSQILNPKSQIINLKS